MHARYQALGTRLTEGRVRTALFILVVLVAATLAAPSGLADAAFPELQVFSYDQQPGKKTDLSLEAVLLASQPSAETVAITVPAGYGATLLPVGARLGDAEVDVVPASGDPVAKLKGAAFVSDPGAFAADPQAQACAPGAHAAIWSLRVGTLSLPIAFDSLPTGGSYRITACLDALRTANLKPVDVYFLLKGVFINPTPPKTYWWSALVTPLDANGAADPTSAYELQGGEPIPETLTLRATWNSRHHVLTARGVLLGGGSPRSAIHVHIYAGTNPNPDLMREIGSTSTGRTGAYVLRQRLRKKPSFLYAHVNYYHGDQCLQPSTAPAGCLGWSIDGTDSATVKTR
jgi:hypothetical protein